MQQNIELGDPGIDPMENSAAPAKAFPIQRLLVFLRKFWWVPVITVILAVTAAILYLRSLPPTFISKARMWESGKMTIPTGSFYTEDLQNYVGTQIELLRSQKMREQALVRLRAVQTNQNAVPLDKDGRPEKVEINVRQSPKSSVFVIDATSVNGEYSRNYLNALMGEYFAYKRDLRKRASMETLASLNSEVTRLELKLQEDQAKFTEFRKSNNLAILQAEDRMAGSYLMKLKTKLSDLKLKEQILDSDIESEQKPIGEYIPPKLTTANLAAKKRNLQIQESNILASIKEWETKVNLGSERLIEVERFKGEIARVQNQYDRFITLYQNLETSRNIDQETIDVLETASAAVPAPKQDVAMAAGGAIGGLILGLGILIGVWFFALRRCG
jgi:uncharacterized protein involved in exopolysaccharide biosynthesis